MVTTLPVPTTRAETVTKNDTDDQGDQNDDKNDDDDDEVYFSSCRTFFEYVSFTNVTVMFLVFAVKPMRIIQYNRGDYIISD